MNNFKDFQHVAISVSDVGRALAFYYLLMTGHHTVNLDMLATIFDLELEKI
jgi:hypothetical protein